MEEPEELSREKNLKAKLIYNLDLIELNNLLVKNREIYIPHFEGLPRRIFYKGVEQHGTIHFLSSKRAIITIGVGVTTITIIDNESSRREKFPKQQRLPGFTDES